MRFPIACGLVLFFASAAHAQSLFGTNLDAASVVPPTISTAGGYASFSLDATGVLTCTVKSWVVAGTGASINIGAAGVNGPVLATLSGGPSIWTGTTGVLGATDIANLRAGGLYVEIDSNAFPTGELRGQIDVRPLLFASHLTGDQETPAVTTTAFADGNFTVNSNRTITYSLVATNLTGGTAAQIRIGAFGVSGSVLAPLAGGAPKWRGTTSAMTEDQFAAMQIDGLYVEIDTSANPSGEIRGQIVPNQIQYGVGSPGSAGVATLNSGGAAMRGGNLGITIDSGLPNGSGLLIFSLTDGNSIVKNCPFLVGAPVLFLPVGLDAGGSGKLSAMVPDLPSSIDVYMQYFGFDASAPNGAYYSTNGVLLPIFDY